VRKTSLILGCIALLVLSAVYCLPNHPSAGNASTLDAGVHIVLFAGIGLWFGWFAGFKARVFLPLFALAALLEVAQWWLGHFTQIEWRDIIANEVGLVLAWLLLWLRARRDAGGAGTDAPADSIDS
jgi:hypothetical protein